MRRLRPILLLVCAAAAFLFWLGERLPDGRSDYGVGQVPSSRSASSGPVPFSSNDPNPPGVSSSSGPTPTPIPRAGAGQPAVASRAALPGPPASPFSRELADPALAPAAAP